MAPVLGQSDNQRWVMEQARLAVMLAAALTATAFTANAQNGDFAAGLTFVRDACKSCHVVEPTNASPRTARTFKTLQHQGYDGDGFFLATPHPKMPNLILTPEQLSDVIAYILSLRENR